MKKLLFVFALSTLLFAYGCGKKTVDNSTDNMSGTVETGAIDDTMSGAIDDTADEMTDEVASWTTDETTGAVADTNIKGKYVFEDANCKKYVALMECLVDKTPEWSKASTINAFERVMNLWETLGADKLPDVCKQAVDALASQSEVFASAGCPLDSLSN